MPKAVDITGQRFGRLVVNERAGSNKFGKAVWSCDCDCGTKGFLVCQNQLSRGNTQSCNCLRQEFLTLGLKRATKIPLFTPRVQVSYPIPDIYPHKPLVNDVTRRRYQFRWDRIEMEVRRIQRGEWKEPQPTYFIPLDENGRRILPLDLLKLAAEKRMAARRLLAPLPEVPASFCTGSSLSDLIVMVP